MLTVKIIPMAWENDRMGWQGLRIATLFIRKLIESISKEPHGCPSAIQFLKGDSGGKKCYRGICKCYQIGKSFFFFLFICLDCSRDYSTSW